MYYIAVCDDDPQALNMLKGQLIELKSQNIHLDVRTFDQGHQLLTAHQTRPFHLIFLDMRMAPMSGMETARRLRKIDPLVPLVIVSRSPEYALQGYTVGAIRYLLKPIRTSELLAVTKSILEDHLPAGRHFFTFTSQDDGVERVALSDIYYFESDLRKIHLQTKQERYTFNGRIGEIEQEFVDTPLVRVHKSFIVNLHYVRQLKLTSLVLDNRQIIPLSKLRHKQVLARFMALNNLT